MAGISKRVSGSWVSGDCGIMKTATDTITTLPAVLYPTGTTATVGLKGNAVQSTTPTPGNPIIPQGCGDMTGNLAPPLSDWVDGYVSSNGTIAAPSDSYKEKSSDYISVKAGAAYTFSIENGFPNSPWRAIGWYTQDKTFISRAAGNASDALYTNAPSNAVYCRLSYRTQGRTTNPMFNLGSTALSYEPYGIKIGILSASSTTPVYLGDEQSTRKIKKLVLTGEENWSSYSGVVYLSNVNDYLKTDTAIAVCTHYQSQTSVESVSETTAGHIAFSKGSNFRLCIRDNNYTSGADFKSYLAQQYANGTPVTVWYVLATETTAIVNEPLMKIGAYADVVSNISIPVTAGGDTISVGTTVQPSEITVNYKGWHTGAVHERESGQWD